MLAKWAAKKYYVFNQEFQASTNDLHAGLSLRLAGEKRSLIETLNKEADDIEANIKSVDEKLTAGYYECENGHEKGTCMCALPCRSMSLAGSQEGLANSAAALYREPSSVPDRYGGLRRISFSRPRSAGTGP